MYGRFDIGYSKESSGGFAQSSQGGVAYPADDVRNNFKDTDYRGGDVRLGFKGSEDLGNGMFATFQMEGRFDGDTGAKTVGRTFFDRESTVGLKFGSHHIRFGRSISAFEQGISQIDVGYRYSAYSVYNEHFGVRTRHSNAMFYNYANGAFSAGADITTKGGYNDGINLDGTTSTTEAVAGTKVAWGTFFKYKANGLELGVAYQDDGVQKAKNIRNEFGIGASYTFAPVTIGASYAQGKDDVASSESKLRNYGMYVSVMATPVDRIALMYRKEELKTKTAGIQTGKDAYSRYGLNYVHNLSKRTLVYADVSRSKHVLDTVSTSASDKYTAYDIGLRHYF